MRPPEAKGLEIDTVSQNRLNSIKKIMKFDLHSKKTSLGSLESPLDWLPPEAKF